MSTMFSIAKFLNVDITIKSTFILLHVKHFTLKIYQLPTEAPENLGELRTYTQELITNIKDKEEKNQLTAMQISIFGILYHSIFNNNIPDLFIVSSLGYYGYQTLKYKTLHYLVANKLEQIDIKHLIYLNFNKLTLIN